jgi:ribose/xylose/arabinose/galactoside ABC-type transport system permease subunit
MNQDQEQLRLLSIFHYVVTVVCALFSFLPLIQLFMGIGFISGVFPPDRNPDSAPVALGWFLVILSGLFILSGLALAACIAVAGRNLARQRRYVFCLVVAAVCCLFAPIGTVLGVFTIVVLMRPSVKALFGEGAPAAPAPYAGP